MREPVEARRRRVLDIVGSRGTVRVSDLAAELNVSVVTVRRDVEELAHDGRLRRGHGVARSVDPASAEDAGAAGRAVEEPTVEGLTVALVVPARHIYLHEILHGARRVLEGAGVRVALHVAPQTPGAERPMVADALAGGAHGLLIAPKWRSAAAEEADSGWLGRVAVPTVLMERRPGAGGALHALDSVCTDHWYGTRLAVDHLVGLGHRRIVLAARDDSPTARAVRSAFAEIAAARPEVADWSVVLSSPDAGPDYPPDESGGPIDLAALLAERRATAAVLHGDIEALLLTQQLNSRGVRVPRDCSVVSYDGTVARLGSTPLTSVAAPRAEIGEAAAELLLRRLRAPAGAGRQPVRRLELLPELQVRGSTERLDRTTD
ncbi:substrate-binding domain-containing protein [Streptomyces profundus]|uniref:substrate-binding domain-containing protein n=1 Tax=Streptomyces profundus TaxID=2867410 RepID=UPI001D16D14C|nr:substrate-binding domain-containing protein [Streptomyces sp. MA3_2.13]UED84790.1 substrate-binding domain-containing protein [Streptomyces sp. MA3_2.13]